MNRIKKRAQLAYRAHTFGHRVHDFGLCAHVFGHRAHTFGLCAHAFDCTAHYSGYRAFKFGKYIGGQLGRL